MLLTTNQYTYIHIHIYIHCKYIGPRAKLMQNHHIMSIFSILNWGYNWCSMLWRTSGGSSPWSKIDSDLLGLKTQDITGVYGSIRYAKKWCKRNDFGDQKRGRSHRFGAFLKWGTPKSSILIGFSTINHLFWVPPFMETPIWTKTAVWSACKRQDELWTWLSHMDSYGGSTVNHGKRTVVDVQKDVKPHLMWLNTAIWGNNQHIYIHKKWIERV